MNRRDFLKRSLATSTLATLGATSLTASAANSKGAAKRDFYELRVYRLKSGAADHNLLDAYLEKAAIPAYNRLGIKTVGAFTEIDSKNDPAVFLLIPYPSIDSFVAATQINADPEYQKAGAEYLQVAKANPNFVRIDGWLMLAFKGMPRLELPPYCKDKKPRMFELRTYESYSEAKAQKKVDMFNSGEIDLMHQVGLAPIFYGQSLIGKDLPHLIYMTSAANKEAHKEHWAAFIKSPVWEKLKNDPQYADTVSKITSQFLAPTSYSQI